MCILDFELRGLYTSMSKSVKALARLRAKEKKVTKLREKGKEK